MYKCNVCGAYFEEPRIVEDNHGLEGPPYEKRVTCPRCLESDVEYLED